MENNVQGATNKHQAMWQIINGQNMNIKSKQL